MTFSFTQSLIAAHSAFCKARPPGIYKKHYLEELNARYIKQHEMALDDSIATDGITIPDWDTKYQPGSNSFEQANPHVANQEYGGEVQTLASEENPYASAGSGGEEIDSTAEANSAPENFKDKKILDVHALNPAKDGTVLRVRKFVTEALGLKNANIFPGIFKLFFIPFLLQINQKKINEMRIGLKKSRLYFFFC